LSDGDAVGHGRNSLKMSPHRISNSFPVNTIKSSWTFNPTLARVFLCCYNLSIASEVEVMVGPGA
jgi:hypothetical protein